MALSQQTAFLQALVERRFDEAKSILQSAGTDFDPNCVLEHRYSGIRLKGYGTIQVTECPVHFKHPAMTVAIQAGLEKAQSPKLGERKAIVSAFMSEEDAVCDIVRMLIDRGANVNAVGDETQHCESAGCPTVHNKTPLCAAIQRGSCKIVELLLDAKADPNHTHEYEQTAWGADERNPLGPGVLKPESWISNIHNGMLGTRDASDPRHDSTTEILRLLQVAGCTPHPRSRDVSGRLDSLG